MRKPSVQPQQKPKNGLVAALLASLTIHSLLLVLLAGGFSLHLPGCNPKGQDQAQAEGGPEEQKVAEQEQQNQPIEVTITERILPKPAEAETVEAPKELDIDGILAEAHNSQECPDFFGGIGITQQYVTNEELTRGHYVVAEVHPGYPAERGGILVGDEIHSNTREIRGEVGTPVMVLIIRHGELLTFNLVREKICITKQQAKEMKARDALEDLGKP